jgi:hypothetical protein
MDKDINRQLFPLFGDFGNGVIIQRKSDPVSQFFLRSEGGGIHEYITSHGLTAQFWINPQKNYELWHAEKKVNRKKIKHFIPA